METFTIPAAYVGTPDATLTVEDYGDSFTMTLTAEDGHVIASASGFRPAPAFGDWREGEEPSVFGSFLSAAVENRRYGDGEFASSWEVLGEDADEWADALTMMSLDEA